MILLVAKSGSGKDYLVSTLKMRTVVSHTTRFPRPGEIDGVHKHFHPTDVTLPDDVITQTFFAGNRYWVSERDLCGKDVFIIDVAGVRALMQKYGERFDKIFDVVQLQCPWYRRAYRMFIRGESVSFIIHRLYHDHFAFKGISTIPHSILKV